MENTTTSVWNSSAESAESEMSAVGAELADSVQASRIWVYGSPILLIVGTIGNILSAVVMTRKSLRSSLTSIYLVTLAVMDIAILYTGLLRQWILRVFGVDVRTLSAASCKMHLFCMYFFVQFEAWLLASIAVERFLSIFAPVKAKIYLTRKTVAIQIASLFGVLALINLHLLWIITLVDGRTCDTNTEAHTNFYRNVWGWMDFCLSSLFPFVTMISLNIAIIAKMVYHYQVRKKNLNSKTEIKMTSMTAILFTITFMFFFTTCPITIYLSTIEKWLSAAETAEDLARLDLAWASVNILMYCNNTINFFLYCLSGPKFRRELLRMLHLDRFRTAIHPSRVQDSVTMEHDKT